MDASNKQLQIEFGNYWNHSATLHVQKIELPIAFICLHTHKIHYQKERRPIMLKGGEGDRATKEKGED